MHIHSLLNIRNFSYTYCCVKTRNFFLSGTIPTTDAIVRSGNFLPTCDSSFAFTEVGMFWWVIFKPKTELLSFFISWRSFADVFIIQLKQAWICFRSTKGHFHDGSAACLGELSCYSKLLTFSIPHLMVSPVQHHIGNFCFQTVEHRISGSVREVHV